MNHALFQNAMNNCIDKCKNFFGNNVLIHQMFTVSIVSNVWYYNQNETDNYGKQQKQSSGGVLYFTQQLVEVEQMATLDRLDGNPNFLRFLHQSLCPFSNCYLECYLGTKEMNMPLNKGLKIWPNIILTHVDYKVSNLNTLICTDGLRIGWWW